MDTVTKFRKVAKEKGMPDEDIDWWVRLARPYLAIASEGDGPVVGHFGGRPALPASVSWPRRMSHLASIDLAALPSGGTDLDLPPDGTLVFFAVPDMIDSGGRVVYVPARQLVADVAPPDGQDEYDRYPLYASAIRCLPQTLDDSAVHLSGQPRHDEKLYRDIMWGISTPGVSLALGGYGTANTGGLGVPVYANRNEVLLAEIYLDDVWVEGDFQTEYATLFYVTTRDRLAARDFDKVRMSMDFLG